MTSTLSRPSTAQPTSQRGRHRSIFAAVVASISGLMFGWDAMALNVVKNALVYHTHAGNGMIGFAVAFGVLTAAFGAFIAGRLSDRIGRRIIMVIAGILFMISSVGTVFVGSSIGMFLFWRFFSGLAMGSAMTIAPAYIAETAPADLRGTLVSLRQFMLIIGLFVCGLLGDGLLAAAPAPTGDAPRSTSILHIAGLGLEVWQWCFLSVAIGGLIYLVTALFVPESPRYLILAGKVEQGRAVLTRMLEGSGEDVDARVADIQASVGTDEEHGFRTLLNKRGHNLQKVVWIGIGLALLQQFVGINAVFYYSTTIFKTLGFGEQTALQQTLIVTGVKVLAIIGGMILIDKVGRRPLMLFGSITMSLALIATASIMLSAPKTAGADGTITPNLTGSPGLAALALVTMCLYVFAYAGTWGPIMWVLVGEMFPNRIRGAATSVAGGAEWMANFIVTLSFPILAAWSIGTTYVIYAAVALFSVFFVLKLVPETKRMELEDMDQLSN